jgi:hypothetical protein
MVRRETEEARDRNRSRYIERRRFINLEDQDKFGLFNFHALLAKLKNANYQDRDLLFDLKSTLASGDDFGADDFFVTGDHLVMLTKALATQGPLQLVTTQIVANLAPLKEKNGISLARSAGPYLVTNVFSGSSVLQEASCVALGNLALAGSKVVKVLVNQEAIESLVHALDSTFDHVQSSGFYALYHVLHTFQSGDMEKESLVSIGQKCVTHISIKCPIELYWVVFVLSCNEVNQEHFKSSSFIHKSLDVCTYEIFQKSDSRPLVKIVTPIVRTLANLCAGKFSETATLNLLRYPDLTAILMALLATNYSHLCKETLWLFSNIVNSDSQLVQEELIEMDFMDKMEFHTSQAIQKIDPFVAAAM